MVRILFYHNTQYAVCFYFIVMNVFADVISYPYLFEPQPFGKIISVERLKILCKGTELIIRKTCTYTYHNIKFSCRINGIKLNYIQKLLRRNGQIRYKFGFC